MNTEKEIPSFDLGKIAETNLRKPEDAFEDFTKRFTNDEDELNKFHFNVQKTRHSQTNIEFWFFLAAKSVVALSALVFILFSALKLNELFSLITPENCAIFVANWHLPVVVVVSFVSAIVAVLAILLRGLSRATKQSEYDDVPTPVLLRAILEFYRSLSKSS